MSFLKWMPAHGFRGHFLTMLLLSFPLSETTPVTYSQAQEEITP